MRRKRTRRNPVWSWDLIDVLWDQILAVGGPDLMPIRINPVQEYGSGFWGVAMPTVGGRWTLKLTADQSEAYLYSVLHGTGLSTKLQGIARGTAVFDTGLKRAHMGSGKPLYLYWREAASHMDDEAYAKLKGEQPPHRVVHARNVIIDTLDVVRSSSRSFAERAEALHKLVAAKLTRTAGVELEALAQDGILVADVHLGNWGIVPRAPDRLTLIDAGMVVYNTAGRFQVSKYPPELLSKAAGRLVSAG